MEEIPAIPARMLNEFVYCPRLAYLEWIQGEFAPSADTVDGQRQHRRVDKETGDLPAAEERDEEGFVARSVWLTADSLGLTAKIDLVEGDGETVIPVDYKRGKRPHVAMGAWEPERVQLCAQGLILREHGYTCNEGVLYFVGSKERVRIPFDDELVALTHQSLADMRTMAETKELPPVLIDSPKCPRCSLVGICLPDEVAFFSQKAPEVRRLSPAEDHAFPLYVQHQGARVRKRGETLVVMDETDEKLAEVRLIECSQLALFGNVQTSTQVIQELCRRNIPVSYLSSGGWLLGTTHGTGHKNVELRLAQFRAATTDPQALSLARRLVYAKIANSRTLLRRNHATSPETALSALKDYMERAKEASSLAELLGLEGMAAKHYFGEFSGMLAPKDAGVTAFDFAGRNRRPPKDPVNALLSFTYSMLIREWVHVLTAVGFDPYLGFYHQPRYGRPALALDLMEEFRPIVADSVVLTVINNGEVGTHDFIARAGACSLKPAARGRLIAAFERRLNQEITHPVFGYKISYRRTFDVQARLLGRHLLGEIPDYPAFLTR